MADPVHEAICKATGNTIICQQCGHAHEIPRHIGEGTITCGVWNIISDSNHCLYYRAIADKPWCSKTDKRCSYANCRIKSGKEE